NPDFTAYLDWVRVTVNWTAPGVTYGVSYGGFGFNGIPSDATITQIKTDVKWKISTGTSHAVLGFTTLSGGTAVGAESVDTSPPTTATVQSQTLTGLALGPTAVNDANLRVNVRATRTPGTTGGGNPDFTASIDSVRVTVTYTEDVNVNLPECNPYNNWTAT